MWLLTVILATQKSKKPSLFLTTLKVLKWELLGIAPSRLAVIGLNISQPFLINNALRFLTMPEGESTTNLGYALIGAFGLVFVGSAVRSSSISLVLTNVLNMLDSYRVV